MVDVIAINMPEGFHHVIQQTLETCPANASRQSLVGSTISNLAIIFYRSDEENRQAIIKGLLWLGRGVEEATGD